MDSLDATERLRLYCSPIDGYATGSTRGTHEQLVNDAYLYAS